MRIKNILPLAVGLFVTVSCKTDMQSAQNQSLLGQNDQTATGTSSANVTQTSSAPAIALAPAAPIPATPVPVTQVEKATTPPEVAIGKDSISLEASAWQANKLILEMALKMPAVLLVGKDRLLEMRKQIVQRGRVVMGVASKDAADGDEFGDNDSTLWAGLLCFSGMDSQCDAVKRSQDIMGRVWRSPRRVNNDDGYTFSRDMALGAMLYLITKKDLEFALKWINWINSQKGLYCTEPINKAKIKKGTFGVKDNRCWVDPSHWGLLRTVWEFIHLPLTKDMKTTGIQNISCAATAAGVYALPDEDFNLHLMAMAILIRKATQSHACGNAINLNKLAENLANRASDNPFYQWLAGKDSAMLTALFKQFSIITNNPIALRLQWSFERDPKTNPYSQTMYWEYVFMINLLLHSFP